MRPVIIGCKVSHEERRAFHRWCAQNHTTCSDALRQAVATLLATPTRTPEPRAPSVGRGGTAPRRD